MINKGQHPYLALLAALPKRLRMKSYSRIQILLYKKEPLRVCRSGSLVEAPGIEPGSASPYVGFYKLSS